MKTYFENEVGLRDISSFHGAEYNPRKMVPERLEQVKRSLAKLGFLLPIYVNKNGVILSGHQRVTAAKDYGYTKVPVVEMDVGNDQEKGANLMFNKGTNDLDTYNSTAKTAFMEYVEKAQNLTAELPDIPPDTYYPCMTRRKIKVGEALQLAGDVGENLRFSGEALVAYGVHMPLLVCGERVINGRGRAFGFSIHNWDECEVIDVKPEVADYAHLAMNFLAMDFDIQKNFFEELRYNAFRRKAVQNQIVGLSRTWGYFVYGRVLSNTALKYNLVEGLGNPDLMLLPTSTEEARRKFKAVYGQTIFDMGAGTLHDSQLMNKAGFDVVPFEPFYCPPQESRVNPEESRKLISNWLDRVEQLGRNGPDSIISSFVLNSIPHHRDRMAYLAILAATARINTPVYIGTQHVRTLTNNLAAHLRLSSEEPNVTLGNDSRFFKAQKFYQTDELKKMLLRFFAQVEVKVVQANVYAKCAFPRRPSWNLLADAIDLEFNLPYADGSRMGLNERAKQVFKNYLSVGQ